jgi:hypothetical protein
LFLDGLDEMPDVRGVKAIERLQAEAGGLRMVLTSRPDQWQTALATGAQLADAAEVGLQPVGVQVAVGYLLADRTAPARQAWTQLTDRLQHEPGGVLVNNRTGQVVATRKSITVVAHVTKNIITAYPSNTLPTPGVDPRKDEAMDVVQRVGRDLAVDAELESLGEDGFAINRYRERRFDPPVRVRLHGVLEYLDSMTEDAVEIFPEVPAREGAYRLLLVHLEESLLVTGGAPVGITLDDRGLVVVRAEVGDSGAVPDAAQGDHRWTIERPGRPGRLRARRQEADRTPLARHSPGHLLAVDAVPRHALSRDGRRSAGSARRRRSGLRPLDRTATAGHGSSRRRRRLPRRRLPRRR